MFVVRHVPMRSLQYRAGMGPSIARKYLFVGLCVLGLRCTTLVGRRVLILRQSLLNFSFDWGERTDRLEPARGGGSASSFGAEFWTIFEMANPISPSPAGGAQATMAPDASYDASSEMSLRHGVVCMRRMQLEEKTGKDKCETFVGDTASSMKGECGAKGREIR